MEIIAKTLAGLEEVLAKELEKLGAKKINIMQRAVSYQGNEKLIYRSNLELRTALRILMPITRFKARNEHQLYDGIQNYYWDKVITKGKTIAVDAVVSSEYFNHSHYVALKTKDAIVDQLRERWGSRPDVDPENADIRINVHINRDKIIVSLDSSGHSLHKRGYRINSVEAPINEVLAAGLLLLAGYDGSQDFADPMCGSGTFLCEAALIAQNRPPQSYETTYSFMHWKEYNKEYWDRVVENCKRFEREQEVKIAGYDKSPQSVRVSQFNIAEAGLSDTVSVEMLDFFENEKIKSGTLVIMNPPYDIRLKEENVVAFFKKIGDHMKTNMPGTTVWIISSNIQALKLLGLKPGRKYNLYNGPNPAKFHKFELYEGSKK